MTSPGVPFANILHQEAIAALAGSSSFERGKRYWKEQRVVSLDRRDGSLTATVNGSEAYAVKIWSHLDTLAYTCSCPQGQEKAFCKHAVATALAWLAASPGTSALERAGQAPISQMPEAKGEADRARGGWEAGVLERLVERLEGRSKEELIELLVGAARADEVLRARILRG